MQLYMRALYSPFSNGRFDGGDFQLFCFEALRFISNCLRRFVVVVGVKVSVGAQSLASEAATTATGRPERSEHPKSTSAVSGQTLKKLGPDWFGHFQHFPRLSLVFQVFRCFRGFGPFLLLKV